VSRPRRACAPPAVEGIEPRILYAADTAVLADVAGDIAVEQRSIDSAGEFAPIRMSTADLVSADPISATAAVRTEIVFVDAAIPDLESVLDGVVGNASEQVHIEVVQLDSGGSGIERIGETLAGRSDISAVHLISHGASGAVQLGADVLDFDSLLQNATRIRQWGAALTADADLLIYGCDAGAQAQGRALMDALARLTGADVAASDDVTGAAALGGDWELEFSTGRIDAGLALSMSFQAAYHHTWELIAQDGFEQAGPLAGSVGGSGWSGSWSGLMPANVAGPSLSDPDGALLTSGHAVKHTGLVLDMGRDLNRTVGTPGSTLWMSFLVEPDELDPSSYAGVTLGNPGNSLYAGYWGNDFYLRAPHSMFGIYDTATPALTGETAFLVVKIEFGAGNDTATLYVNPTPGLPSPDSPAGAVATKSDIDLGTFTRVALVQGSLLGNDAVLDELRIGTSYLDVAPASVAPTATGLGTAHVYVEDQELDVSGIVVSDADSASVSITMTLSNPAAGTLTTGTYGSATSTFAAGTWSASGAVADVNELLENLHFVPASDGSDGFTVLVSVTDGQSAPLTASMNVFGIAVNDAPGLALAGSQASVADGSMQVVAGFATVDTGGGAGEAAQSVTVSVLAVDDPTLFSVLPHIDASGTLRYQALAGVAGAAIVSVIAHDDGGSVLGGHDSTTASFTICLTAPSAGPVPPADPAPGPLSAAAGGEPVIPAMDDPGATSVSPSGSSGTAVPGDAGASSAQMASGSPSLADAGAAAATVPPGVTAAEEDDDEHQILVELARYPGVRMLARAGAAPGLAALPSARSAEGVWTVPDQAGALLLPAHAAEAQVGATGADGTGMRNAAWVRELDQLRRLMQADDGIAGARIATANVVLGGGLSVGYVLWLLRSGLLLSTLVSTLPAWAVVDPLPVLARGRTDEDDAGTDSADDSRDDALERLFARARAALLRRPVPEAGSGSATRHEEEPG